MRAELTILELKLDMWLLAVACRIVKHSVVMDKPSFSCKILNYKPLRIGCIGNTTAFHYNAAICVVYVRTISDCAYGNFSLIYS